MALVLRSLRILESVYRTVIVLSKYAEVSNWVGMA